MHDETPTQGETTPLRLLRALADEGGIADETPFDAVARQLAATLGLRHALVAQLVAPASARILGRYGPGAPALGVEWELGGPAALVAAGRTLELLAGAGAVLGPAVPGAVGECFLGGPLLGRDGTPLGFLCAFDTRHLDPDPLRLPALRVLADRGAAELLRQRVETSLRESELRYRDLYEEAPIAYVQEDLQSRIIGANRAALRILGLKPEEVIGTVGRDLVPDTPSAQQRVKEALASVGRGTDTRGVVLELRRKDDGKPIFLQWWSKPDPGGQFTRTMFLDITELVLAEEEKERLRAQNRYLQEELTSEHNFDEIVGRSPALLHALQQVESVAPTDASVLLTGETGTGKELFARAIHRTSARKDGPLVKVNCGAIPPGLVESELFGHVKGAFTGAVQNRTGRFELANGGTIFLDEVSELPLEAQVKLLRVLQEQEFEPVGASRTVRVDVRVIAASNRGLEEAVAAGRFRADLLYRLNVFPIRVPPLRERSSDIPLLVSFHLDKFARKLNRPLKGVSARTMALLTSYEWPGNVRELQNVIERAVILARGPIVDFEREVLAGPAARPEAVEATLAEVERGHLARTMKKTGWVVEGPAGAAQVLGLHPNTLRSMLKRFGVVRPLDEPPSDAP